MSTQRHHESRQLRRVLALIVLVAGAQAATGDETRMSGRRNGTLQGPGLRALDERAYFQQFQSFQPCIEGEDNRKCDRGVAHVVIGAGLRNAGYGTLRLRGLPSGAIVEAAYLYIGVIERPSAGGFPMPALTFNGYEIHAMFVAGKGRHCWETGPGTLLPGVATLYRANVTGMVTDNDDYAVAGVPSAAVAGTNPFDCPSGLCNPLLTLAQGVSLVVVYRHPRVPLGSAVYIHEPREIVPFLAASLHVQHDLLPPAPGQWKLAFFSSIGGDGQTRDPDPIFQAVAPISTFLTLGADSGYIRGANSDVEPNADWTGSDGGTLPQLWDARRTRIYRDELGTSNVWPIPSYSVLYEAMGGAHRDYDCVNPSVHVLGFYAD